MLNQNPRFIVATGFIALIGTAVVVSRWELDSPRNVTDHGVPLAETGDGFAATDQYVHTLFAKIPEDHWLNLNKDGVLESFGISIDKLRGHGTTMQGRLNCDCWRISKTYWLVLSSDYAFPDRTLVEIRARKPWF